MSNYSRVTKHTCNLKLFVTKFGDNNRLGLRLTDTGTAGTTTTVELREDNKNVR